MVYVSCVDILVNVLTLKFDILHSLHLSSRSDGNVLASPCAAMDTECEQAWFFIRGFVRKIILLPSSSELIDIGEEYYNSSAMSVHERLDRKALIIVYR